MKPMLLIALMWLLGCDGAPSAEPSPAALRARLEAAAAFPVAKFDLGAPTLTERPEVTELVAMGPRIVPALLRLSEAEPAPRAAYAVMALGRLKDPRARAPLESLRSKYQARPAPDSLDLAVIGQCDRALALLPQP